MTILKAVMGVLFALAGFGYIWLSIHMLKQQPSVLVATLLVGSGGLLLDPVDAIQAAKAVVARWTGKP